MKELFINFANPLGVQGIHPMNSKQYQWKMLTRLAAEIRMKKYHVVYVKLQLRELLSDIVKEMCCPILSEHKEHQFVSNFIDKVMGNVANVHDHRTFAARKMGRNYLMNKVGDVGEDKPGWMKRFYKCLAEIKSGDVRLISYMNFIGDREAMGQKLASPCHEPGSVRLYQIWCLAKDPESQIDPKDIYTILYECATAYKGLPDKQFKGVDYTCSVGLEKRIELHTGQVARSEILLERRKMGATLPFSELVFDYVSQNVMLFANCQPSQSDKQTMGLFGLNKTVANYMQLRSRAYLLENKKDNIPYSEISRWAYVRDSLIKALGQDFIPMSQHWLSKILFGQSTGEFLTALEKESTYILEDDLSQGEALELSVEEDREAPDGRMERVVHTVTLKQLEDRLKESVSSIRNTYIELVKSWAGPLETEHQFFMTSPLEAEWILSQPEIFAIRDKSNKPFLHQLIERPCNIRYFEALVASDGFKPEYLAYKDDQGRTALEALMKIYHREKKLVLSLITSKMLNETLLITEHEGKTPLEALLQHLDDEGLDQLRQSGLIKLKAIDHLLRKGCQVNRKTFFCIFGHQDFGDTIKIDHVLPSGAILLHAIIRMGGIKYLCETSLRVTNQALLVKDVDGASALHIIKDVDDDSLGLFVSQNVAVISSEVLELEYQGSTILHREARGYDSKWRRTILAMVPIVDILGSDIVIKGPDKEERRPGYSLLLKQDDFDNTVLHYIFTNPNLDLEKMDMLGILANLPKEAYKIGNNQDNTLLHAAALSKTNSWFQCLDMRTFKKEDFCMTNQKGESVIDCAVNARLLSKVEKWIGSDYYTQEAISGNTVSAIVMQLVTLESKCFALTAKEVFTSENIQKTRDKSGEMVLHRAVWEDKTDWVIRILGYSQDANILIQQGNNGNTPLHYLRSDEMLELLCESPLFSEAMLLVQNNNGSSVLDRLLYRDCAQGSHMVARLLEMVKLPEAICTAQDIEGDTVLHTGFGYGNVDKYTISVMANFLGYNIPKEAWEVKNKKGEEPLDTMLNNKSWPSDQYDMVFKHPSIPAKSCNRFEFYWWAISNGQFWALFSQLLWVVGYVITSPIRWIAQISTLSYEKPDCVCSEAFKPKYANYDEVTKVFKGLSPEVVKGIEIKAN